MARRSGNPARRAGSDRPLYWHGGRPGLRVGDVLTPGKASLHALRTYAERQAEYPPGVFVTSDRQFARGWASTYGVRHGGGQRGSLYQVQPDGELLRDPDYLIGPAVSWHCSTAVITRVAQVAVRLTEAEEIRAVAPYTFWTDGSPQYSPDGILNLRPAHARMGITQEMLEELGPWRSIYSDSINYELRFLVARARGAVPADATIEEFRASVQASAASGAPLPRVEYAAEQ